MTAVVSDLASTCDKGYNTVRSLPAEKVGRLIQEKLCQASYCKRFHQKLQVR
jgi:hypothetical protein